jgi:hypothetical protein
MYVRYRVTPDKLASMSEEKIPITELKEGYYIYGNKGNVWNDNAHIYKSGHGTLCNVAALSTNWAKYDELTHVGCEKCIEKYKNEE